MQLDKRTVYSRLIRPVHIAKAQINMDEQEYLVVCEFSYLIGALLQLENKGDSTYVKHIIRNTPGAIKRIVQDFNNDAKPDIMTLFAQGNKGIFLFNNNNNGKFSGKEVLRFRPSYGFSYFELYDFNHDGYSDILYTCGNNADYLQILKPYHGMYIYLNLRYNHFKQSFFYPLYDCYKVMAKDFDNDDHVYIAAIVYFADFAHQPEEGFIYLENEGNLYLQPFSLTITQQGI